MSGLSDEALDRLRFAASAPDLTGTRYRLLDEIGLGGMSTVFLVEDPTLGRRVALKVLDVPDSNGELALRLTREAQVLARLEHPGIAPVHEVGQLADGRVYYTMKYVEGPRLDTYAASKATLAERLRLFQRIAEAVAFAHDRGVLHRDLKPENIMVGPFGEVLVMDWGLARSLDAGVEAAAESDAMDAADLGREGVHTAHGAVLGTPGYMAPEQAHGDVATLDTRTDVYALGAVMFFLLTQKVPPADAAPPPVPGVPKPLLAICRKAMAHAAASRYANALEIGAEIARYLDGRRVEAYPEGLRHKAVRLYSRHKIAFWLVIAYLVVRSTLLFLTGR
jgi:serine/threonine-protein kinase